MGTGQHRWPQRALYYIFAWLRICLLLLFGKSSQLYIYIEGWKECGFVERRKLTAQHSLVIFLFVCVCSKCCVFSSCRYGRRRLTKKYIQRGRRLNLKVRRIFDSIYLCRARFPAIGRSLYHSDSRPGVWPQSAHSRQNHNIFQNCVWWHTKSSGTDFWVISEEDVFSGCRLVCNRGEHYNPITI